MRNLITDVAGVRVGNAHDARAVARAVARGVYEAAALPYATSLPDRRRFGP